MRKNFKRQKQIVKVETMKLKARFYQLLSEEDLTSVKDFMASGVFDRIIISLFAHRADVYGANEDGTIPSGIVAIGNVVGYDTETDEVKVEVLERYTDFVHAIKNPSVFVSTKQTNNGIKIVKISVYVEREEQTEE